MKQKRHSHTTCPNLIPVESWNSVELSITTNQNNQNNHNHSDNLTTFSNSYTNMLEHNKFSKRKPSLSSPQNLNELKGHLEQISLNEKNHKKKNKFSFRRFFSKDEQRSSGSNHALDKSYTQEEFAMENARRQAELKFAHELMNSPDEMGLGNEASDLMPDSVQTICSPYSIGKAAIRFDRLLCRIDITNARVKTLSNLASTALLASDQNTLDFLEKSLDKMRKKLTHLIKQADELLPYYLMNPKKLLPTKQTDEKSDQKVIFSIADSNNEDEDEDIEEKNLNTNSNLYNNKYSDNDSELGLKWEMSSLQLSSENSSAESDDDNGPNPKDVKNLAKQIKKIEGRRFKQKFHISRHNSNNKKSINLPPPPNPLGHTRRDLLRSHATVPSGLCQQARCSSSSSISTITTDSTQKITNQLNLPFNLLSLTGQLSWLISEYLERGSSTYKWATELINSIGKMSVNRATWLNIHQQLRETTELLYTHRDRKHSNHHLLGGTPQYEFAWSNLQAIHQLILNGESNSNTITVDRIKTFYETVNQSNEHRLVPLSLLLEKKLHLAYLCDLLLWKAHKIIFMEHHIKTDEELAKCQLMDFQIRLFELQLDEANSHNWSTNLIDWMICWLNKISENQIELDLNKPEDRFCLNELKTFKISVELLENLVTTITGCKLMRNALNEPVHINNSDTNLIGSNHSINQNQQSHHHHQHHYHPHHYHHGQGDFRTIDADRCSRSYAALIRQIQDQAVSNRPLGYFAERALYDIAMELNCTVDWDERFISLTNELKQAWQEWEILIKNRISSDGF